MLSSRPPPATGPVLEFLARGFFLRWWFFLRSRAWAILRGIFEPADLRPSCCARRRAAFRTPIAGPAADEIMAGVVAEQLLEHLERSLRRHDPSSGRAALGHGLEGTWRLESDPADGPRRYRRQASSCGRSERAAKEMIPRRRWSIAYAVETGCRTVPWGGRGGRTRSHSILVSRTKPSREGPTWIGCRCGSGSEGFRATGVPPGARRGRSIPARPGVAGGRSRHLSRCVQQCWPAGRRDAGGRAST